MSNYKKPVISIDNGLAEGVYAASGCYTTSSSIHQRPETGRGDYHIQIDGIHHADHTKNAQTLKVTFNQPVTYVSCNANGASYLSGNGTNTISISLGYHQNPTDNIGFGDLVVTSESGLEIVSAVISD